MRSAQDGQNVEHFEKRHLGCIIHQAIQRERQQSDSESLSLSLLLICRHVHSEAAGIPLQENTFNDFAACALAWDDRDCAQ